MLLCTDGSDLALAALERGLAVVAGRERIVVATVVGLTHDLDVVGTGMAGGVMSADDARREDAERRREGQRVLDETCRHLGLEGVETVVLSGDAGAAICDLVAALPAAAVVIGTRGRSGLRRAMLGSVSDHVVRNAPRPVVVCSPG